jgi:hypothetical protein
VRVDIRGETQHLQDDEDYAEGEWVENAEGVMEFRAADGSVISAAEWTEASTEGEPAAAGEPATVEATTTSTTTTSTTTTSTTTTTEEGGDEANS